MYSLQKNIKKIRNEFDLDELSRNQKISVQDSGVCDILNLIKESKNMEDIKNIKYRDAPLGYSIVSSFVSTNRTTEINKKYALMAGFCGLTLQEAAQIVSLMAAQAQR